MPGLGDRRMGQAHPYHPPASVGFARSFKLGRVPASRDVCIEDLRVYSKCLHLSPRSCRCFFRSKAWLRDVGDRGMHRQVGGIIDKIADRLRTLGGSGTLGCRSLPEALRHLARRSRCQQRSLQRS